MTDNQLKNKLYYGDNLVWLHDRNHFPNEFVDLIYLDPPFNSNKDYNVIFKEPGGEESKAQMRAFDDSWKWDCEASALALNELGSKSPETAEFIGWLARRRDKFSKSMAAYLGMMAIRLLELHRVLKPTGSLYLHCDPTASHYLKIILDIIFGNRNLRNEIVWHYRKWSTGKYQFQRNHDIILFYSKTLSPDRVFNQLYMERAASTLRRFGTARIKSGYDVEGRRIPSKMEDEESGGARQDDMWEIGRVPPIKQLFPTEKPPLLLERIIAASANKDSIILDPFCGCGTTIIEAQKEKLRWIGIDVTWLAIDLVEKRLRESYGEHAKDYYEVYGNPYDVASAQILADKSKKEFEIWALSLVGAAPRERDGGVDGIFLIPERKDRNTKVIVQVKGGKTLIPAMVRDLIGTVDNENAAMGLLVTLETPTSGMRELAVHTGSYKSPIWDREYPRVQIRTVGDLLEGKGFDLPYGESPMKKAEAIKQQVRPHKML